MPTAFLLTARISGEHFACVTSLQCKTLGHDPPRLEVKAAGSAGLTCSVLGASERRAGLTHSQAR